jgi:hypothetical protein
MGILKREIIVKVRPIPPGKVISIPKCVASEKWTYYSVHSDEDGTIRYVPTR